MFTKISESQDLPRFDRSKKDVTIYTIIYIYRCYVIKYIDVTILKKIIYKKKKNRCKCMCTGIQNTVKNNKFVY